jgi:phosphopantothenoylcysteine decarboxylase/phosphopantothenate--cysteine ligase
LPKNIKETIRIKTAAEMLDVCVKKFHETDIAIMSAAVADYRPMNISESKIKKSDDLLQIQLEKTTDILLTLGQLKNESQLLVGFALETNEAEINAKLKLEKKGADMIILNSMQDKGAGFAFDTNKITIFDKDGSMKSYGLKSKKEVASDIADYIQKILHA